MQTPKFITFPLILTPDFHAAVKAAAEKQGITLQAFFLEAAAKATAINEKEAKDV